VPAGTSHDMLAAAQKGRANITADAGAVQRLMNKGDIHERLDEREKNEYAECCLSRFLKEAVTSGCVLEMGAFVRGFQELKRLSGFTGSNRQLDRYLWLAGSMPPGSRIGRRRSIPRSLSCSSRRQARSMLSQRAGGIGFRLLSSAPAP
jgi:hypothetical protein